MKKIKQQQKTEKKRKQINDKLEDDFQTFLKKVKQAVEDGKDIRVVAALCSPTNPQVAQLKELVEYENNLYDMMDYLGYKFAASTRDGYGVMMAIEMGNSGQLVRASFNSLEAPVRLTGVTSLLCVFARSILGDTRCVVLPYYYSKKRQIKSLRLNKYPEFLDFEKEGWGRYSPVNQDKTVKFIPVDNLWTSYKFNCLYDTTQRSRVSR